MSEPTGSLVGVRTFLSALLTLIAMVAIGLALPSMWLSQRVVDSDGFADVVAPLAHDAQVQDFIADQITDEVSARVAFPGASALVKPLARSYTQGADFPADFSDVVRQQHAWLFDPAPPGAGQEMQLDITAMVNRALKNATLPFTPTIGTKIEVPLTQGAGLEAGRFHKVGQQLTNISYSATAVAVIAGLLALLVARRRGTVLAWLGIGALLAALASWVTALNASRIVDDQISTRGSGSTLTRLATDALANDLTSWAMIAAIAGAIAAVIGIGVRIAGR